MTVTRDEYGTLTIASDFIFGKLMKDPKRAEELIRRIFPKMPIDRIEIVETQKDIENGYGSHGVRLDVYVKTSDKAFTLEMQVINTKELPLRSRYYQSSMDQELLEAGTPYSKLPESYVVFICPFDPFGEGRHIYTFRNYCSEDKYLDLDDKETKVFLNAAGVLEDVGPELKRFLDYVMGKMDASDNFIAELDDAVHKARKNEVWRREYMTMVQRDLEKEEQGKIKKQDEMIRNMLRENMPTDMIARIAGVTVDYVQKMAIPQTA